MSEIDDIGPFELETNHYRLVCYGADDHIHISKSYEDGFRVFGLYSRAELEWLRDCLDEIMDGGTDE